jgi:predicted transcriptional regulator
MKLLTFKYVDLKIKSVYSQDMVKTFRQMYSIKDNIQYLLYGQMIPENGFSQSLVTRKGTNKLRNTRTQNLREYMDKTRYIEDNTK